MIDHFIFDFDGTISDSYPLFNKIVHTIAQERGYPLHIDAKSLDRALKTSLKTGFTLLGWDALCDWEDFLKLFHDYQASYALKFQPFPEAVELLERIEACQKSSYIYTHSGSIVNQMLENMGISKYFKFVLDASYGFPLKPKPNALLFLSEKLELPVEACMMIGDRTIDAEAGMRAGMVGCLWDAEDLFPDFLADVRVRSLLQIDPLKL